VILVDTSVWIDFLAGRATTTALRELLLADEVTCHPAVRGEVALGNLAERVHVLDLLAGLPRATVVDDEAVMDLVSRRRLHGVGLGWVDAHLLASADHDGAKVWTHDKRLLRAADRLGVARRP
jgi:predicted nucleic acid-binding protein